MHRVRDPSVRQKDADYARGRTYLHYYYLKMDEKVIECVRNREILYNHTIKDYKNASKKQEAWEQIASELNITATECKTKWNLLRNAFIHAMSRRKTVTGQGVKIFKKWKFEDEMAFLLPYMANRNTIAAPVGEFSHDRAEMIETLNENNSQQKKRHINNYHEDMLKLMKARSQRRSEKNDIDLFFNSIAETVKKFPKLEQIKLKFQIMNMVHEIEMKLCLESDGVASISNNISTPPHFNRHTFSPHYFSPSPQSFDTHYSPSPPVTQQVFSPQYLTQSSPSPRIAYSPSPPVTQQVSSPQYVPQSSPTPQITYSPSPPVTQQGSSPQYVPQSSPTPQIAYSPSPPVTQQVSSPQYVTQSSPSPQIAYSLSSPQFIPQSSLSSQMAYHTASLPNIQPSTSQISQSLLTSNTQDAVVEISIPELNSQKSIKKTSARSQGAHRGPAHTLLKEFLIIKKKK